MRYFLAPLALALTALGTLCGTESPAALKPHTPTGLPAARRTLAVPPGAGMTRFDAKAGPTRHPGLMRGPGTVRKPATAHAPADLLGLGKRQAFDRARQTTHAIDGKRQVLTPASLGGVKAVRALYTGRHSLGRFETESASRLLKPGTHYLTLAREGGAWRVYAVREGGARVHQATKVTVRYLKGAGGAPANEVRTVTFVA